MLIALVAFLALMLVTELWAHPLRGILFSVVRPLWSAELTAEDYAKTLSHSATSKDALIAENTRLRLELAKFQYSDFLIKALERENADLKAFYGREGEVFLTASVLARPPRAIYDTLVVDIGSDAGIEVGARVYAAPHIVIGDVQEVYSRTAVVSLYSSSGRETEVLVGDVSAIARGRGSGNYVVVLPRSLAVATGTPIVLGGTTLSVFGEVDSIEAHPADPEQTIYFRNPISISSLRQVIIEADPAEPRSVEDTSSHTDEEFGGAQVLPL